MTHHLRHVRSEWIKRNLKRAKLFESQKIAWRIFFLERKEIDDKVEEGVSKYCELLLLLRGINVAKLAVEMGNPHRFSKICEFISGESKDSASPKERAKLLLLNSRLFAKTMRILQMHYCSTLSKPITSACMNQKLSIAQATPNQLSSMVLPNTTSKRQTAGQSVSVTKHRKPLMKRSHSSEEDNASLSDMPVRRIHKPSTLDSVFLRSLSQASGRQSVRETKSSLPRPKIKKNRPGQRTRRMQAEKLYGSTAKHVKTKKAGGPQSTRPKQRGSNKDRIQTHKQSSNHSRAVNLSLEQPHKPPSNDQTSEELHPSWIASKRRKEMEKTISQPQGTRIVFEDSD